MSDEVSQTDVTVRAAVSRDAPAIAALHAASWQAHYRGSLSDAYLDGPVETERQRFWAQRLEHPRPGQIVLLADQADHLVGFVCVLLDHDVTFGTLIDNLHVIVPHKGRGIGRLLMHHAGRAMWHALPQRPAYLYVLEANGAAQRFYDRTGGMVAERGRHTEPDGSEVAVLRYVWATPAALIEGTSSAG